MFKGEHIMLLYGLIGWGLAFAMCWQESKLRKINFFWALFLCVIITPLIAYFIISGYGLRNPRGCKWCGNTENEAEFCGICRKNENGDLRPF